MRNNSTKVGSFHVCVFFPKQFTVGFSLRKKKDTVRVFFFFFKVFVDSFFCAQLLIVSIDLVGMRDV